METPSSSTRRVTRSQTLASSAPANNNSLFSSKKVDGSEKMVTKSRQRSGKKDQQQDRSALIDITNDSPIVGVAMGNLETPLSAMSKKRMVVSQAKYCRTPGSGEALLRGQVKTLLQKVEEAEVSKITTMENRQRPFFNNTSPIISLVAPTPANTPQVVLNLSADTTTVTPLAVVEEKFLFSQMEIEMVDGSEVEDNLITRSLLLDFSEKSDSCVMTRSDKEESSGEKTLHTDDDDDDESIWSIQVNASSTREEEGEGEEEDYDGVVEELCEGMSNISVDGLPKFEGKHIRFVYNSDDELQGEEEEEEGLHHLRFPQD